MCLCLVCKYSMKNKWITWTPRQKPDTIKGFCALYARQVLCVGSKWTTNNVNTTDKYRRRFTELTHWGWDKMDAISQTTLSNAFLYMKMLKFWLKFHWSLFLRVQLTIFQHWFRYYLNQWWLVYWRIYASLGLNELREAKMVDGACSAS